LVKLYLPQLENATGLKNQIWAAELIRNAYAEIGGSLSGHLAKWFKGDELATVCARLHIDAASDASRDAARRTETKEPPPDDSEARAEAAFSARSSELFKLMQGLNGLQGSDHFKEVGQKRVDYGRTKV